jgi:hypothetical protein
MFAIIQDGIVADAHMAKSLEEAQTNYPNCLVIEVNLDNSPWFIGSEYIEKNNF